MSLTKCTLLDVSEALTWLLSVGLLKGKNAPDDAAVWASNYHQVLEDAPAEGLKLAIKALAKDPENKYVPPAAWLRHQAWEAWKASKNTGAHRSGSSPVPPEEACPWCGKRGCRARLFVTERGEAGPRVRFFTECAPPEGAVLFAEARCPHPGCGCPAVELVKPQPFVAHGRTGRELRVQDSRTWAWECQALTHADFKGCTMPPEDEAAP